MQPSTTRARALAWIVAAALPTALVAAPTPPDAAAHEAVALESVVVEAAAPEPFRIEGFAERHGTDRVLVFGSRAGVAALGAAGVRADGSLGPVAPVLHLPASFGERVTSVASVPEADAPVRPMAQQRLLAVDRGFARVQLESSDGVVQGTVFEDRIAPELRVRASAWFGGELLVVDDGDLGVQQVEWPDFATDPHLEAVCVKPDGLLVRFTAAQDLELASDPSRYTVRAVGAVDAAPGEPTRDLVVRAAAPLPSGRGVRLFLPQLLAGETYEVVAALDRADGTTVRRRAWTAVRKRVIDRVSDSAPTDAAPSDAPEEAAASQQARVLVFSRTTGFRHGSIPDGWRCFAELATERGFVARITEDPSHFDDASLESYDAVVFLNTTGDVLDDEQQAAFERFVAAGGGFLGVHSASDTEYDWPWYGQLVAAYFKSHPRIQEATVRVTDARHPATAVVPTEWVRTDEWYNFREPPRDSVRVLLELDQDSYEGSEMPRATGHPIAWCHTEAGGRAVYTAGGHTKAAYAEPLFREHLWGALSWAAGWAE